MKMNLTLIALATAAVFDASDIGTFHSFERDAGLGCSALLLKPLFKKSVPLTLLEKKSRQKNMIAYLSLAELVQTSREGLEANEFLRITVEKYLKKFDSMTIFDVQSVINKAEDTYISLIGPRGMNKQQIYEKMQKMYSTAVKKFDAAVLPPVDSSIDDKKVVLNEDQIEVLAYWSLKELLNELLGDEKLPEKVNDLASAEDDAVKFVNYEAYRVLDPTWSIKHGEHKYIASVMEKARQLYKSLIATCHNQGDLQIAKTGISKELKSLEKKLKLANANRKKSSDDYYEDKGQNEGFLFEQGM